MINVESLERTINVLGEKATKGMQSLLSKQLLPPINSTGIISHTGILVVRSGNIITISTDFPDYAAYVEHGRKPGKMPPEQPITDWVKRHNIAPDAVFPIRRKIAKEGTKPKPFTEPLRRMVEMVTKTCLSWGVKYVEEQTLQDMSTLEDVNISI